MGQVVAAISTSHAPGALGWPDAPATAVRDRIAIANHKIADYLAAAKRDVIIAFLDDHFENHFRNLLPTFAVGVAPVHRGPGKHLLEFLRFEKTVVLPGDPETAGALLQELIYADFDVARMGEVEYGNNLMVPLKLIRPQFDIPIIPVFINVFTPPLTSVARAYAFGEAIRNAVERLESSKRVAFLGTGGLSHWPPVWLERSPNQDDAFLKRMKRYQTEGRAVLADDPGLFMDLGRYEIEMARLNQYPLNSDHPLVNANWDLEFLRALERGDVSYMRGLTRGEIEKKAGHGGFEILNWVAVMGAMRGAPAIILEYEPVIEWICGMGYAVYDIPVSREATVESRKT